MRLFFPDIRLARPATASARTRRRLAVWAGLMSSLLTCAPAGHGQRTSDLAFTYTQERSKFVGPDKDDFFYMRGATIDYATSFHSGLGLSINGTGMAVTNLRANIDIHQATFLIGPRYTLNFGHIMPTHIDRKGSVFAEAKIGYTFATEGQYPDSSGYISHNAAALTYSGGLGANVHVYHRLDWRALEVDLIRTQLPNGSTNVQNTLRLSSGVNFHFGY